MKSTFTRKVKDEISHHVLKNKYLDKTKISYSDMKVKNDLRLKFINHGVLCEPNYGYHFEYRFKTIDEANETLDELLYFDIEGRISINEKRNEAIIYIVDMKTIMKLLKLLGASSTLKEYKRIVEEKKKIADTNRIVNFETANIKRTANAALRQCEDIKKLLKRYDINSLDSDIRIVVKARNKYKTLSLTELSEKIGVSKSVINHRFMKIRKMLGE
ncbi:MAG: DNA-binding protein WhiA [Lachnospiraceae bacterium]|nr:DNA-binding protein WhiA [Lachnospiraceae bacterium]